MTKQIIDDIGYYNITNKSMIVGSLSKNEFVKVTCSEPTALIDMIKLFDGKTEINVISEYCVAHKINIDLEQLIAVFSQRGLFVDETPKMSSEIQKLGFKIFLKEFSYKKDKKLSWIAILSGILTALITLVSVVFCVINFDSFIQLFNRELLRYKNSYLLGIGVTLCVSIAVLLFHEAGHCLAASLCKISIHRIGLYLYLGFMPKWFISFRGIRVAENRKKIFVFSAGSLINLSMIFVMCAALIIFPQFEIGKCIIVSCMFMILNCLIPFSLTDGYFIFSTLIRTDNIRDLMFRFIRNIGKKKFTKKSIMLIFYILVNFAFWIYKIYMFYFWIWNAFASVNRYGIIVVTAIASVHLCLMIRAIRKK